MVELLTVAAIISLLVGLLIPALSTVRRIAKETRQKAQFTTMELGLTTFKNDYGDYPPSDWLLGSDYCGAQKLAEALLGWDLMGLHPQSVWRADGLDAGGGPGTYDPAKVRDGNGDGVPDTLDERKGRYVELATASAFRLGSSAPGIRDGLFDDVGPLAPYTFVLCDVFGAKKVRLADGSLAKAGLPVLYYKADTSQKTIQGIYDALDNDAIVVAKEQEDLLKHPQWSGSRPLNPLCWTQNNYQYFYNYIRDPKVDSRAPTMPAAGWPYRPDSYILISAGPDGFYGTEDDIRNFGD
jgi:hypothetical protein